jgi:hypothetical protein
MQLLWSTLSDATGKVSLFVRQMTHLRKKVVTHIQKHVQGNDNYCFIWTILLTLNISWYYIDSNLKMGALIIIFYNHFSR